MKVLVINCGSSSLKYQFIDMADEQVLAKGLCERIGMERSYTKHARDDEEPVTTEVEIKDHSDAIMRVVSMLMDPEHGVIADVSEISAVGHRVVHGAEQFSDSTVIDESVLNGIKDCIELAPLHNPPNIIGIEACEKLLPGTPNVAVFDTAFHQTMPKKAYLYALPYDYYQKHRIRKYGFHGTSHKYVAERVAMHLKRPLKELKVVTCHLGNGSSICAVDGGKSVETSMGYTPLDGLMMGTRCGSIDPAIVTWLMEKEGIDAQRINDIMNKNSGMIGVTGLSSDFRDVTAAMETGDKRAILGMEMFTYQVRKYIGQYAAAMGGIDALVFTAGIGENVQHVRMSIVKGLEFLGIEVDPVKNEVRARDCDISTPSAKVRTYVIATNEELAIARDTARLLG
jgi:acetate kinase